MKQFFLMITALVAMMWLIGCDNNNAQLSDYTVTCSLQGHEQHDSATLLVHEDAYDQLRRCATARAVNGTFTFKGQTDRPKVGIILWDNDSTRPFYFVLEGGHTRITIHPGQWTITGSKSSSRYLHYLNLRNSIMAERLHTWQEYLTMARDSSLKQADERRLVERDSLLNDSLQRLTASFIDRNDPVGYIVGKRFGR